MSHINKIQNWLNNNDIDVAYVSNYKNIAYFTGFNSDPIERTLALFIFSENDPFILAPALEVESVKKSGWKYPVYGYLDYENPYVIIKKHIEQRNLNPKKWAIEKNNLTIDRYEKLKEQYPNAQFTNNLTKIIQKEQLIKNEEEINKLKVAGQWADFAFEIGFNALKKNYTERQVVAEIEYALMKKGIMHMSFDTIIQSGANASDPHGEPKNEFIKTNKLVLLDLGVIYKNYISDATRTVAFGNITNKEKEIYNVCLEAQLAAQDAVKPGIYAWELDKIARDIISKAGYEKYFIHRLGHGIGQSEHEFPSIMKGNDLILQPGMCFSIEPGIYIPGKMGVRIEDCVYVTKTGCKPFTNTSKKLKIIPIK